LPLVFYSHFTALFQSETPALFFSLFLSPQVVKFDFLSRFL
jgi:hypothetical protein